MLVTIFSDASICEKTGATGWASWAKCDRGSARGDGAIRRRTMDSSVAEAMAAVNGIVVAARRGLIREGDVILVQTDNNAVMQVLTGKARRGIKLKQAPGPFFGEMRTEKRAAEAEISYLEQSANDDPAREARIVELRDRIAEIRVALKGRNRKVTHLKRIADERNDEIRDIARVYETLVNRLGITVKWRHCKGHKGLESRRSSVNEDCDKRARKWMQEARRDHLRMEANLARPEQRAAEEAPATTPSAKLPLAA